MSARAVDTRAIVTMILLVTIQATQGSPRNIIANMEASIHASMMLTILVRRTVMTVEVTVVLRNHTLADAVDVVEWLTSSSILVKNVKLSC